MVVGGEGVVRQGGQRCGGAACAEDDRDEGTFMSARFIWNRDLRVVIVEHDRGENVVAVAVFRFREAALLANALDDVVFTRTLPMVFRVVCHVPVSNFDAMMSRSSCNMSGPWRCIRSTMCMSPFWGTPTASLTAR